MRILAVDTALGLCSAAIFDTDTDQVIASESRLMERGHAEALMPLLERVVDQVDGGFSSLGRVATTIGPGSFTGLRVGLAAARAIGVAASLPVVGISTLSAFAGPYLGMPGVNGLASVIDARHDHVFMQIVGGDGRLIVTPCLIPQREAMKAMAYSDYWVTGSAASLMDMIDHANAPKPHIEPDRPGPEIEWVARLGAIADPASAPPIPLYLRQADATPQHNGRIARL